MIGEYHRRVSVMAVIILRHSLSHTSSVGENTSQLFNIKLRDDIATWRPCFQDIAIDHSQISKVDLTLWDNAMAS